MDLVEARARGFTVGSRHPWERARLSVAARLIARYVRLRPGDVVLDVGCGDTFVVESLARQHPETQFYAVDSAFTSDLIEVFRARMTVSNVQLSATLDGVPRDRRASLVLLMDVLEHVHDDVGLLDDITGRPCFGQETCLLITVPAYERLFSAHDRFLGHCRRYSRQRLGALIRDAHLSPIAVGHLFASLVPVRALQVIRERVSPRTGPHATGLARWRGGEALARVLTWILEWDGRLGLALLAWGVRLPGLSHFAVCKKSV
jgi:hypothetical protein